MEQSLDLWYLMEQDQITSTGLIEEDLSQGTQDTGQIWPLVEITSGLIRSRFSF